MAKNSLTYAVESDLREVFNDYYKYTSLTLLTGEFEVDSSHVSGYTIYKYNGIATPSSVFGNGVEFSKISTFTAVNQWKASADGIELSVLTADIPKDDVIIEIGKAKATAIADALVLASEEFNSKIDNKYPRPLPMTRVTHSTDLEYESIVKRATCLICAKNLIKARDPLSEEAISYDLEAKEIIEGLNDGSIKLVWEQDATEVGTIEPNSSNSGGIVLEQVVGSWRGKSYDIIKIQALDSLELGSGEVLVFYGSSINLGNDSILPSFKYKPSGSFDHISNGLMLKFSQSAVNATYGAGDRWEIPVTNTNLVAGNINSSIKSIAAIRNR